MDHGEVEIKTNDVGLLISILELLKNTVSIDRSSDNIYEKIVNVCDYGQQFINSIKSIKEAIKNKLIEIKKDIENSVK